MPLSGGQVAKLAGVIDREWDVNTLQLFASDHIGLDLAKLEPNGGMFQRAFRMVNDMSVPPKDRILLEKLQQHGNAAIKAIATELAKPKFISPTGASYDAIVLGRAAFVDRQVLRDALPAFTAGETRVLIIRGPEPCGKSYSFNLLRQIAAEESGAVAMPLELKGSEESPFEMVKRVFSLLGLDLTQLPTMTDKPQENHIVPLVTAFTGQLPYLKKRYWLVIDDLNDPDVTGPLRETAYDLARAVERTQPENLWVALLGYNAEITDSNLRFVAQEDAQFFTTDQLAKHFELLATAGGKPLTTERATEIATLLMTEFAPTTKVAMENLTMRVEAMGDQLLKGVHP